MPRFVKPPTPEQWAAAAAKTLRENDHDGVTVADGSSGAIRVKVPSRAFVDVWPSLKVSASGPQAARDPVLEVLHGAGYLDGYRPGATGGMRAKLPADLEDVDAAPPVQVLRGDMLETLRAMPADRFHAVVTDPPYGLSEPLSGDDAAAVLAQWLLDGHFHKRKGRKPAPAEGVETLDSGLSGFMNASWDGFVPSPRQWAEVLRVLRPGGYALVFAGTRTAGWMAISLMLAGFEVLDQIDWLYGEGFPKGGDVSKRIDKAAGAERAVVGVAADFARDGHRRATNGTHELPGYKDGLGDRWAAQVTAPATDEAARWEDWSTTLKPAHEPIIVARKPLRAKSVGANLLAWQAGALNIGACRIPCDDKAKFPAGIVSETETVFGSGEGLYGDRPRLADRAPEGRWPANVILSHSPACGDDPAACAPGCAAAALDEQGGDRVRGSRAAGRYQQREAGDGRLYGPCTPRLEREIEGSSGGPTRFFYCAKASRADRECGLEDLPEDHDLRKKGHPTVKPTALMRWLVRLVCPPAWRDEAAGEVLDPFGGSGSTGVALALEGFRGVLVERDERFAEIATRRVARAVEARASGEVPKAWREKKPKPTPRAGPHTRRGDVRGW